MIATNIVYFSLVSAPWMSAVSVTLTRTQRQYIARFERRTNSDDNWTEAHDAIGRMTLDDYFTERVEKLESGIYHYARTLNFHEYNINHDQFIRSVDYRSIDGEIEAPHPNPELLKELRGLRKLVFLIRDSNLRILNDIKQALGNRHLPSTLATINDQKIQSVAARYADVRVQEAERPMWIEPSIVGVALLYSLNTAMLNHVPNERLRRYQTLINKLHDCVSLFMRIQTRVPYFDTMDDLSRDTWILENSRTYGYGDDRIQTQFRELSDAILSVVVIYGSWEMDGKDMLLALLVSEGAIRRYMDLDPTPVDPVDVWSDQVLEILAAAVTWTVNHPWHRQLGDLVKRLRRLG
jgi:hypothetical protein